MRSDDEALTPDLAELKAKAAELEKHSQEIGKVIGLLSESAIRSQLQQQRQAKLEEAKGLRAQARTPKQNLKVLTAKIKRHRTLVQNASKGADDAGQKV